MLLVVFWIIFWMQQIPYKNFFPNYIFLASNCTIKKLIQINVGLRMRDYLILYAIYYDNYFSSQAEKTIKMGYIYLSKIKWACNPKSIED